MLIFILSLGVTAGCTSLTEEDYAAVHSENHAPMPETILKASPKLQEVYGLAVNYPNVLEKVPCYCGCDGVGHENNLDCYIAEMGEDQVVMEWDRHGAT